MHHKTKHCREAQAILFEHPPQHHHPSYFSQYSAVTSRDVIFTECTGGDGSFFKPRPAVDEVGKQERFVASLQNWGTISHPRRRERGDTRRLELGTRLTRFRSNRREPAKASTLTLEITAAKQRACIRLPQRRVFLNIDGRKNRTHQEKRLSHLSTLAERTLERRLLPHQRLFC